MLAAVDLLAAEQAGPADVRRRTSPHCHIRLMQAAVTCRSCTGSAGGPGVNVVRHVAAGAVAWELEAAVC